MNNMLGYMVSLAKNGGDPRNMLAQMARSNPELARAHQMISGKNSQQLRQMAENMAKESGTSVEQIARQLGLM